jgi:alkanesulfonate monooxygenase SsuD/methylene tetrahydromethanopterin reductase-like flavin-dependent oxidoreductase (luciferase family)
MRVGLYCDLRNPPGWRRDWSRMYAATLERIVEAERLGLDSVWFTEHHLFEDGYLPQPLTLCAAAAARTSRMRVGTSVMLAPIRPAIDIAEQAAVVDILSGGRLELGLGTGYRIPEFAAYGQDMARRYELLESRARELRELWEGGRISPPPVQEKIPLWIAALGPRGARLAGRLGAGVMNLREDLMEPYETALSGGELSHERPRCAGPVNLILADDPEATWAEVEPYIVYQAQTYRTYGAEGTTDEERVASKPVSAEWLRSEGPDMNPPKFDVVTPEEAIRRMRIWLEPLPVEHIFFWESVAGMPDAISDRHLELIASEIVPAMADVGIGAGAGSSQ